MSVHVDEALVAHVAKLARLELPAEQLPAMVADLSAMVALAEQLGAVELAGVEPMHHPALTYAPPRPDIPGTPLAPATLEALAPAFDAGGFVVPRVVE